MKKAQRIKEYNASNKGYAITGIKKCSKAELDWARANHAKSLDELYNSYSNAKRSSYNDILQTYKPDEIIGLQGSSMAYSVTLVADNGDTLWITRCNNYLVEVTE
jgi:hypothetical protein